MGAQHGGPAYDMEYRVVRPNGEVRNVHSRGDVTRDELGRPRRLFGTVQDITERKRAEENLRESERRYRETQMALARVNRVTTMGQLTASIAHEVNQPIAAAITSADAGLRWLAAQPPDLEEVRDTFDRIIKAGNQAGEVIGRIRALIKKVPARKASLDINEAILEDDRPDTRRDAAASHRAADRPREWSAAHSGRPSPTATGDPELDHERRRSDERNERGIARVADRHEPRHAGWRDRRRTGFGSGSETGEF